MRLKIVKTIILIWVLTCPAILKAQTHEAGGIIGIDYDCKIVSNFHWSLGTEGRFNQNFTKFNRFKLHTDFNYAFWEKRFKFTLGADYLLSHQTDDIEGLNYYENRGRIAGTLGYTGRIKQFRIGYRLRAQATFYEKKHKIHKYNPKTYLRNRLEFAYHCVNTPIKVYASTECFLRLYKNFKVDEFRTVVGMDYKFDTTNSLGIYFRADNEVFINHPENVYYIGIVYGLKSH